MGGSALPPQEAGGGQATGRVMVGADEGERRQGQDGGLRASDCGHRGRRGEKREKNEWKGEVKEEERSGERREERKREREETS